jgi:hypothetical protein
MAADFEPNRHFEVEMLAEGVGRPELIAAAEQAAELARADAPVSSGNYRDSINAGAVDDDVLLWTDSPYGALIEWGSEDTPVFATLRTAAEQTTGNFTEAEGGD